MNIKYVKIRGVRMCNFWKSETGNNYCYGNFPNNICITKCRSS